MGVFTLVRTSRPVLTSDSVQWPFLSYDGPGQRHLCHIDTFLIITWIWI